jgi:hypothetical protein
MTEGGNHGGPSDLETLVPIVICPIFDQATKAMKEVKPGKMARVGGLTGIFSI